MAIEPNDGQVAKALAALDASARHQNAGRSWPHELVTNALAAGASLEQIAAAVGMERDEAWERLTRDLGSALRKGAIANADLSESEALELAVTHTNAVRRERSLRRPASQRRSGLSI